MRKLVTRAFKTPDLWQWTLDLVKSLRVLDLTPNFYRAQNIYLERWNNEYAGSLSAIQLRAGLAVARELELQLGFQVDDQPESESLVVS